MRRHAITLVAIGDGTAAWETQTLFAAVITNLSVPGMSEGASAGGAWPLQYMVVSEAGNWVSVESG